MWIPSIWIYYPQDKNHQYYLVRIRDGSRLSPIAPCVKEIYDLRRKYLSFEFIAFKVKPSRKTNVENRYVGIS